MYMRFVPSDNMVYRLFCVMMQTRLNESFGCQGTRLRTAEDLPQIALRCALCKRHCPVPLVPAILYRQKETHEDPWGVICHNKRQRLIEGRGIRKLEDILFSWPQWSWHLLGWWRRRLRRPLQPHMLQPFRDLAFCGGLHIQLLRAGRDGA